MGSIKTFIDSLTAGEVAVLVGVIGFVASVFAIVTSIFTTRYIVKHGPDYSNKIDRIDETLAMLVETQDQLREQQDQQAQATERRYEKEEKRAEAARWKPIMKVITKVENNNQANYFRLESCVEFSLIEVSLCTQNGAKVHDFPNNGAKLLPQAIRSRSLAMR